VDRQPTASTRFFHCNGDTMYPPLEDFASKRIKPLDLPKPNDFYVRCLITGESDNDYPVFQVVVPDFNLDLTM